MTTSNEAEHELRVVPPEGPPPPKYPQPSFEGQQQPGHALSTPSMGYQPQGSPMSPSVMRTPAQVGQDYQSELFARCAQGLHEPTRKYGACGIITAVLCFPIGLICLFTDSEQKCARCGVKLA